MRTDYIETGRDYSDTEGKRAKLKKASKSLEWIEAKGTHTGPMMQLEGIKTAVREFGIPDVRRFSYSSIGSRGFYGIEAGYSNALVRIYIVDEGSHLVPVFVEVDPDA